MRHPITPTSPSTYLTSIQVVISSAVISLRARHSIDFTHRSISREVTDHHPIAKRPYEVINLATLDLVAVIPGSGRAGVWRRDA
ncbi:Undecaprenyl-diphosphatase, partial [Dissostichus eleginoides]